MTDVQILNQGSVMGFVPLTDRAQDWFLHHVQSEDWQWLGSTLWVDKRMALDLIAGIMDAGLVPAVIQ